MSTSSPAILNCGSKPPTASSASRRKAMLQPGMCSATSSESSTWIGPPGALRDALSTRPASSGTRLGPPMPAWSVEPKACAEVAQPVAVGPGVVVDVGDDLARGRLEPGVPGAREPAVLGPDQADVELGGDRRGAVGRAVVDDDHLVVRVVERVQRLEAAADRRARRCTSRRRPRRAGCPCPGRRARRRTPARPRRGPASAAVRGRRGRSPSRRRRRRRDATRPSRRRRTRPRSPTRTLRAAAARAAAPGRRRRGCGCRGRPR